MLKFSIITPCLNAEKHIEETIRSVIGQKGDFSIQYLIVDGGSGDGTLAIVRKYKELVKNDLYGGQCRGVVLDYVSEKDNGMYHALVKGFRQVTGDVVAYVNADDYYLPHAFSTVAEIFIAFPDVHWLTAMNMFYNNRGQITACWLPLRYSSRFIRKGMYDAKALPIIQQESTFWRSHLLGRLNYDRLAACKLAGDYFLWHSFSQSARLYIVESCLAGFRVNPGQLSSELGWYFDEFYSIADKRTLLDRLLASIDRLAGRALPAEVKKVLNGRIIRNHRGAWWKTEKNYLLGRIFGFGDNDGAAPIDGDVQGSGAAEKT
jgi:glycosyltransferase involved in cell wall biosynthesis